MTNIEKWFFYNSENAAPENFIEWGAYSMVSAALQRKVWTGSYHYDKGNPLFPSQYIVLIGEPGVGKGLVIKPVKKILGHFRKDGKEGKLNLNEGDDEDDKQRKQVAKAAFDTLIPIGADATTVEKLIEQLSKSVRMHWWQPQGAPNKIPYFHSSMTVCSEEISTLFKKHTQDLVNFFLQAFDSGDFRYETLGRGTDYIKNCCFNFLAGTTPGFIRKVFGDELLNEGFASRVNFVFASQNRFWRAKPPTITPEQEQARDDILQHIKRLTTLFGEVKFTSEADEYLEHWWTETNKHPHLRPNSNPKLIPYYARKNIHVQRLAIAQHFLESCSMEITLDELKKAIATLDKNEINMHLALSTQGANPLGNVTIELAKYITKNGPISLQDLWVEFYEQLPGPDSKEELKKALDYLVTSKRVILNNQLYEKKKREESK